MTAGRGHVRVGRGSIRTVPLAVQSENLAGVGDEVRHPLSRGLGGGPEFEVLSSVVVFDAVSMVDVLRGEQGATEMAFHHDAVFTAPVAGTHANLDVAVTRPSPECAAVRPVRRRAALRSGECVAARAAHGGSAILGSPALRALVVSAWVTRSAGVAGGVAARVGVFLAARRAQVEALSASATSAMVAPSPALGVGGGPVSAHSAQPHLIDSSIAGGQHG